MVKRPGFAIYLFRKPGRSPTVKIAVPQEISWRFHPAPLPWTQRWVAIGKPSLINCSGNADSSGLDITEGQFPHHPDYTCKCSCCLFSCFLTCLELVWKTLPGLAKEHSQYIIDLINNSCIHSFNKHLYLAASNSGIVLGTEVSGTKPKTDHILADGPEQEAERVDHKAWVM